MSLQTFTPELGQKAPADATIFASLSHYGKHWFLRCKDLLPKGRGVVFLHTETAESLVPGSKFVGWHQYKVTEAAFEVIQKRQDVAVEMSL